MNHDLIVKAVLDYVENRVTQELPAEEVAAVAGFSPQHFREVFRQATGQTLARYIRRRRLSHAALALVRTERPVTEIAIEYGFGSHDTFTRAFRREFGATPSDFRARRRPVRRRLIVPGVFGPSLAGCDGEELPDVTSLAPRGRGTLYGVVPKVSYFSQEKELTPFPSCLRACLTYLGQDVSYARLLAASGAAFRLLWNPEHWDGGNVDIMAMHTDPTVPLRRTCQAAGWDFRLLFKAEAHGLSQLDSDRVSTGRRDDFIALIRTEIDAGRPLIGFGIIGPPEACIIAGYQEEGEVLVGWNFFQEMPEYASGIETEPCGYFRRRGWYEHPDTIGLMALPGLAPAPHPRKLLTDTLTFALEAMENPQVAHRASGFAAYEAWARALLQEDQFPAGAPLPMLLERLMCQVDAMTMVGEGRDYAAQLLVAQAQEFPEVASDLIAAAECLRRERELVEQMAVHLGSFAMDEKAARRLAQPDVRRRLAALIRDCATADQQAAAHLRSARSGLLRVP